MTFKAGLSELEAGAYSAWMTLLLPEESANCIANQARVHKNKNPKVTGIKVPL